MNIKVKLSTNSGMYPAVLLSEESGLRTYVGTLSSPADIDQLIRELTRAKVELTAAITGKITELAGLLPKQ